MERTTLWLMSSSAPSVEDTRGGRVRRIHVYLNRMFPPAATLPYLVAYGLAADFGLQAIMGRRPLQLTWRAAAAALSIFLLGLLMRVLDEFKDADADRALAEAGDPRYLDRPTVTGAVTLDDLRLLRRALVLALLALNLPLGFPYATPAFLAMLALLWLSSRWFFWPAISRHLLLAFATHNPIPLAMLVYIAAVYAQDFGPPKVDGRTIALLLGLWLPWTAWETSRKIRVPADETAYETYSKVLGWRAAALVPAACVLASLALLTPVLRSAGLGGIPLALLFTSGALVVLTCLRFRFKPSRERARLRPFVDVYGTTVNLGIVIGLALQEGVLLG